MNPFFAIVIPCVILLLTAMFFWQSRRSEQIIQNWAKQGGHHLLMMKRPLFNLGPFLWMKSRQQTIYRIEVQNGFGQVERAWIRCGNWWTGVTSDDIEVRWDDEK